MNPSADGVAHVLDDLIEACRSRDWSGSDPYDGLTSPIYQRFPVRSRAFGLAVIQGVRRFPIDLRPLLGIKSGVNAKGLGLFARASLKRFRTTGDETHLDSAVALHARLKETSSEG